MNPQMTSGAGAAVFVSVALFFEMFLRNVELVSDVERLAPKLFALCLPVGTGIAGRTESRRNERWTLAEALRWAFQERPGLCFAESLNPAAAPLVADQNR